MSDSVGCPLLIFFSGLPQFQYLFLSCSESSEKRTTTPVYCKSHIQLRRRLLCDFKYHNPLVAHIPLPGVGKAKVMVEG